MNLFLSLLVTALCLCLHLQVEAGSRLSLIEQAVITAKAEVDSAYSYSRKVSLERVRRSSVNPSDIIRLLKQPSGPSRLAVRSADYMDYAVKLLQSNLARRHKRSINATDLISEGDLESIAKLTGCSARRHPPSCRTTPNLGQYRTASSVCNNAQNTRLGSSNIPFVRWLPAEYQDETSLPKGWDPEKKINSFILPLVRHVSNQILSTKNSDVESDPLYTHLVTIFGQLTDHDLTFTPHSPVIRSFSDGIDCDKTCERTEPCFPIAIPENDQRFGSQPDQCMPFFRSAAACGSGNTGHIFGASTVRQQLNTLTAFIDAGHVYGSDDTKARFLRDLTTDEGLLRTNTEYTDDGRELLPFTNMHSNMCATRRKITNNNEAEEVPCFLAGDERSNENIGLTSLHTLFVREHNRLARALAELNPHWNGERLYQEARKIMGAYFQVITYRDYLLHIVGPDVMAKQLSNYPGYDEDIDPSISNVFATAAYRFAHLMIQPFMFRLNETYDEHPEFPSPLLHTAFFTPWRFTAEGGLDPVIRGLVGRRAKLNTPNKRMHDELRENLFKFSNKLALDLAALNMQRGRDHGLPGYNKWRKFCGLSQPKNLTDLAVVMNNNVLAEKLIHLYGTVDNIDVWLAGVTEPFLDNARVGPLFACLIATQFQKIRQGDRMWWEKQGVFTEDQRDSLRDTSLARIICDNTGIEDVPEHPFQYQARGKGYTQCKDIPDFDLTPWIETEDDDHYADHDAEEGSPGPQGPPGPPGPRGPPGPPANEHHVAFSMRLGNDFPTSGEPIVFHEVIYNGQNSYNVKTGFFTCEEPGVYQFTFTCVINKVAANVNLMLNKKPILHSFTTFQRGFSTATGTLNVKLAKGDEVWLMTEHGSNGMTADSYFSGTYLFDE